MITIDLSEMAEHLKRSKSTPNSKAKWSIWFRRLGDECVEKGYVSAWQWMHAIRGLGWELGARGTLMHWRDKSGNRERFIEGLAYCKCVGQLSKVSVFLDDLSDEEKQQIERWVSGEHVVDHAKFSIKVDEWVNQQKKTGVHQEIINAWIYPIGRAKRRGELSQEEFAKALWDVSTSLMTKRIAFREVSRNLVRGVAAYYVQTGGFKEYEQEIEPWEKALGRSGKPVLSTYIASLNIERIKRKEDTEDDAVFWVKRIRLEGVQCLFPELTQDKITDRRFETREKLEIATAWGYLRTLPLGVEEMKKYSMAFLDHWAAWARQTETMLFVREEYWTSFQASDGKGCLKLFTEQDGKDVFKSWMHQNADLFLYNHRMAETYEQLMDKSLFVRALDRSKPQKALSEWYNGLEDSKKLEIGDCLLLSLARYDEQDAFVEECVHFLEKHDTKEGLQERLLSWSKQWRGMAGKEAVERVLLSVAMDVSEHQKKRRVL